MYPIVGIWKNMKKNKRIYFKSPFSSFNDRSCALVSVYHLRNRVYCDECGIEKKGKKIGSQNEEKKIRVSVHR